MALFNNISFNIGFFTGPNIPFCSAFTFGNRFIAPFFNPLSNIFFNNFSFWNNWNNSSFQPFYPILPELPQPDFNNLVNLDIKSPSIWDNNLSSNNNSIPATPNYFSAYSASPVASHSSLREYNSLKGQKLANVVKSRAHGSSHCAKYVREALDRSGLLTTAELGTESHESAYMWIGILRKHPDKFKEIRVTNTNYKNLPAGAIMVYDKGVEGYSSEHGHIQISTGDGKAAHYCIQNTIKKPSAIFLPV